MTKEKSHFELGEEIELEQFEKGYDFIKENLPPFKFININKEDDNAYTDYIMKMATAITSYEDMLNYRIPKEVLYEGTNYTCPVCHRVVKDTDHFCYYCGQRIKVKENN